MTDMNKAMRAARRDNRLAPVVTTTAPMPEMNRRVAEWARGEMNARRGELPTSEVFRGVDEGD